MARVVMKGLACACLVVFISAVYFRQQKGKAKTTPVSSQVRVHDCTTHIHYLPHACPVTEPSEEINSTSSWV